jgi:hypothetical protein
MMERIRPTADDLVDALFLTLLGLLALVGFSTAYGGSRPVTAGLIGLGLGIVAAYVGVRLRLGPLPLALTGVGVFFLLGGAVAVRATTAAGMPTVATLQALVDGAVRGWARLVTTVPPTGEAGNLIVVPFLCGLACGLTGYALARRHRLAWLPIVPPVIVLALGILLGTLEPASLLLQGAAFCVVLMLWISVRGRRGAVAVQGVRTATRVVGAVAMLALVAAGAVVVGPHLPLANANERLVLRDRVEPPFDPRDFSSPLVRMRKYVTEEKDTVVFTASGLPEGSRIRLATMDYYDGTVWNVAGGTTRQSDASGYFERVGDRIPPADGASEPKGTAADVTFTVGDYSGIWLPGVGPATSVVFGGPNAQDLARSFRYNRETSQGVATAGLRPGDTVTMTTVVPGVVDIATLDGKAKGSATQPEPRDIPASIKDKLTDLLGEAQNDGARAVALGTNLRETGFFSQGQPGQGESDPGHSAYRLDTFLTGEALVGDAEQYAATAALMARGVGLPTRVVMGWIPPAAGTYQATGKDVTAWIEVLFDGVGWVPIDVTPASDRLFTAETTKPKPQPQPDVPVPPQTKVDLTPPVAAPADEVTDDKPEDEPSETGGLLGTLTVIVAAVGIPLTLILLPLLAIVSAKARRRRRRRNAPDPAVRIAGGWDEVVDRALDRGVDVGVNSTRTEAAGELGGGAVTVLARGADAAVFGARQPTEHEAADYWAAVGDATQEGHRSIGPWRRLRAAVSTRSIKARRAEERARRTRRRKRER